MIEQERQIITTGGRGRVGRRLRHILPGRFTADLDQSTGTDIKDYASVFKEIARAKGDTVLHLAAFTEVGQAQAQFGDLTGEAYLTNVIGTRNIAKACKELGKHLIFVSTDYVFDGEDPEPYTESSKTNPKNWYGQTKAIAEREIEEMDGLSYTIMRIAVPYQASSRGKPDLVRNIQARLRSGDLPPQFTNQRINPTFVDDIACAVDVIETKKPQGIVHVVGSSTLSPYELARKIAELSGFDPNSIPKTTLEVFAMEHGVEYPRHLNLSNRLATQGLKIPLITAYDGLREVMAQQNGRRDRR